MMLWTASTLRHRCAKGWLCEANHYEGSRPRVRLSRLVSNTSPPGATWSCTLIAEGHLSCTWVGDVLGRDNQDSTKWVRIVSVKGSIKSTGINLLPECRRLVQTMDDCALRESSKPLRATMYEMRKKLLEIVKEENAFASSLCVNDLRNWTTCLRTAAAPTSNCPPGWVATDVRGECINPSGGSVTRVLRDGRPHIRSTEAASHAASLPHRRGR